MKSVEFCYWLQGMFELQNPEALTKEQTKQIRKHLNMVFAHEIDKSYDHVEALNVIHSSDGFGDTLIRC